MPRGRVETLHRLTNDEDDFDGTGGSRNPPKLGEESVGEEEREIEVEFDCVS